MSGWIFLTLLGCISASSPSMYGEIMSPNYPQGYPSNAKETWEISAPEGFDIRLYFIHLDIEPSEECEYDFVQVVVGGVEEQKLCGRMSVGSLGAPLVERIYPTSSLQVVFQSDFSNQERYTGFSIYHMAVDRDECAEGLNPCSHFCNNYIGGYFCSCPPEYYLQSDSHTCAGNCSGGLYTELRGQISSPRHPSPYLENADCVYRVRLQFGFRVILNFLAENFDIEAAEDGSCSYDTLTIKAGGVTFGPYCGPSPPSTLNTGTNEVDIIFHTDSSGDNTGWRIRYSEEAVPCSSQIIAHATLDPQNKKYVFRDTVTVTCEEGYETLNNGISLPSFRSTCQGDGTWTNNDRQCQLVDCGEPDDIEMGSVTFTQTTFGSLITYSCHSQYYKLVGEGTFRCSSQGVWMNKAGSKDLPRCAAVCGIPSKPVVLAARIFGGSRAEAGNFPWQVAFTSPKLGGGVLISERWVLTAAHVVQDNDHPEIVAGVININKISSNILEVNKIIIHPQWQKDAEVKKNFDNDIALVQLKRKVVMGSCISPICLPDKRMPPLDIGRIGQVAGWGRTEKRNTTKYLWYTAVNILSLDNCKLVEGAAFTENMICAGAPGKDSCEGDSGGPLIFVDLENPQRRILGGLVSWGLPDCGINGFYTKVQNYLDWIEDTIRKEEATDEGNKEDEAQNLCN